MAVVQARVTDPRTLAGDVRLEIGTADYQTDQSGSELGLFSVFVAGRSADPGFRDNVVVVLTRFVVDATVDINDLFDHAFNAARAFNEWTEQRADRYPIGTRTSGATVQAGSYLDSSGRWLYTVNKYAAYQRANVAYLLQCTGTTASTDLTTRSTMIDTVGSARLED
ncbi:LpqN/LpqT family lipoprotein [Gordonia terrae]|uniref:LpqN/LpqT family lipoprotein n=1 Tax=Gordonia terrae TaxID=2055 RepID=UPI003F6BDA53